MTCWTRLCSGQHFIGRLCGSRLYGGRTRWGALHGLPCRRRPSPPCAGRATGIATSRLLCVRRPRVYLSSAPRNRPRLFTPTPSTSSSLSRQKTPCPQPPRRGNAGIGDKEMKARRENVRRASCLGRQSVWRSGGLTVGYISVATHWTRVEGCTMASRQTCLCPIQVSVSGFLPATRAFLRAYTKGFQQDISKSI